MLREVRFFQSNTKNRLPQVEANVYRGEELHMIKLTELAATALHETLDAIAANPGQGLRLRREDNRLILHLDVSNQHDLVICHQNRLVLIIGPETRIESEDAVIDAEIDHDDPYLILRKLDNIVSLMKDRVLRTVNYTYGMYN